MELLAISFSVLSPAAFSCRLACARPRTSWLASDLTDAAPWLTRLAAGAAACGPPSFARLWLHLGLCLLCAGAGTTSLRLRAAFCCWALRGRDRGWAAVASSNSVLSEHAF